MKSKSIPGGVLARFLPTLFFAAQAQASVIYLTTTTGAIYQYDSVTDMAAQTTTTTSGTLVTTIAAYGTDQGTTMDLSTGTIYRINAAGDVVSYSGLPDYLANTGTTIALGIYAGNNSLNGFSYDGATGGFYAIGSGAAGNNAQGDLIQWGSLADFVANANRTVTVSTYNGNLFNFYDPDGTAGSTFGPPVTSRTTRYYQSSGTGRLEGWESLAHYMAGGSAQADKRVHYTAENVYAGTSTAFGANTIDVATAFAIPEPGAASLAAAAGLVLFRRRKQTGI
jgi:hypothetical protein